MNKFKYELEPYKGQTSRHTCPNCNKKKSFARYIDEYFYILKGIRCIYRAIQ